jgi:hypothetical protein
MDERAISDLWIDGDTQTSQPQGEGQLRLALHIRCRNENDHHADSHVTSNWCIQEALSADTAAKEPPIHATEQATPHWGASAVFGRVDALRG